jgi:hypothetical protein
LQSGSSLLGVVVLCDGLVRVDSSLGWDGVSGVWLAVGWACCASALSAATAMPMYNMAAITQTKLDFFVILSPRLLKVACPATDRASDFFVYL